MNNRQELKNAIETALRSAPTSDKAKKKKMVDAMIAAYSDVDHDFMNSLYWPDSSEAARMPQRFPQPTALFTQKYHLTLNTGAAGEGTLLFMPQDTTWFSLASKPTVHLQHGPTTDDTVNSVGSAQAYTGEGQDSRYIPKAYSEVRCVGASINIRYIGTQDECSGIMTCSHQFNKSIFQIDEDSIENGFHKKTCKPQEGLRAVYMPKNQSDLEFRPTDHYTTDALSELRTVDYYNKSLLNEAYGNDDLIYGPVYNQQNGGMNWQILNGNEHPTSRYIGMHDEDENGHKPNTIAIIFQGMPINRNWLRVDVVRHFEAVPREHLKDFVSLKKSAESEKTLNFVEKAGHNTLLHTQTQQQADVHETFLKPVSHTLPDDPGPATQGGQSGGSSSGLFTVIGDVLGAAGALYAGGGLGGAMAGASLGGTVGGLGGQVFDAVQSYAAPYEKQAFNSLYNLEQKAFNAF